MQPPIYTENLNVQEEHKPILMGAGDYSPCSVPNPENSKDIPSLVGVYQCFDCIGIVGWDKTTKATFLYHMNEFDERRMTYGIADFIIKMLEPEPQGIDDSSPKVRTLKLHMERLEMKYFDYDGEVNNLIDAIKDFNLLDNTRFTLVSKDDRSLGKLTTFLTVNIGLKEDQLSADVPQNLPNVKWAQLVINRNNGEICKNFTYNPDDGITYCQSDLYRETICRLM